MRTLFHLLFGALGGFALGILGPIAFAALMYLMDPQGMRQGGATPFAIMIIVTAPMGAVAGAVWGYRRLHPPGLAIKKGIDSLLEQFEEQFAGSPVDRQRLALSEMLPTWLNQFRKEMKTRLVVAVVIALSGYFLGGLAVFGLAVYLTIAAKIVMKWRAALATIRRRWGDALVDQLGEPPLLLREFGAR